MGTEDSAAVAEVEQPVLDSEKSNGQKTSLNRHQVVRVFQLAGYKSADGWPINKLMDRACRLNEEHHNPGKDHKGMETKEDHEMLDRLISIVEQKQEFEVVGDKHSKKEENSMTTNENGVAVEVLGKSKMVKKESKERKAKEVDKFGNRLGTVPAQINAAITDYFQSPEDIAKKASLTKARVLSHLNWWSKAKKGVGEFLIQEEGKWKLSK